MAHMDTVTSWAELGQRIRAVRSARGMHQGELAERCALDRTAVNKIENGTRNVSALELNRLADALDVTFTDLVSLTPEPVKAARAQASTQGSELALDVELALEQLMRDVNQLSSYGLLPRPVVLTAKPLGGTEDAVRLARRCRDEARLGTDPLGNVADVCASFGLWVQPVCGEFDGVSVSPEPGLGAALVSGDLDPGRRRMTAIHELGHHLTGDTYAVHTNVGVVAYERERLVDAFAAELLLPQRIVVKQLKSADPGQSRERAIGLAVEYRVSWSVVTTIAAASGCVISAADRRPSQRELLEVTGRAPEPDLVVGTMAAAWVKACLDAESRQLITPTRAIEMARGVLTGAHFTE